MGGMGLKNGKACVGGFSKGPSIKSNQTESQNQDQRFSLLDSFFPWLPFAFLVIESHPLAMNTNKPIECSVCHGHGIRSLSVEDSRCPKCNRTGGEGSTAPAPAPPVEGSTSSLSGLHNFPGEWT